MTLATTTALAFLVPPLRSALGFNSVATPIVRGPVRSLMIFALVEGTLAPTSFQQWSTVLILSSVTADADAGFCFRIVRENDKKKVRPRH